MYCRGCIELSGGMDLGSDSYNLVSLRNSPEEDRKAVLTKLSSHTCKRDSVGCLPNCLPSGTGSCPLQMAKSGWPYHSSAHAYGKLMHTQCTSIQTHLPGSRSFEEEGRYLVAVMHPPTTTLAIKKLSELTKTQCRLLP